jgi:predicted enzyme related to lactoylglutathione lyase
MGWDFGDSAMPDFEYYMVQTGEDQGGAIYPADPGQKGPIVYFDTDDIDATSAQIRERGGQADEKAPIPGIGWFARAQDPEGNSISLFQADESVPASGEH